MDKNVLGVYAVVVKEFADGKEYFTAFDITKEVRNRLPLETIHHYEYRQHIHDTLAVYDIESEVSFIHNGAVLYKPVAAKAQKFNAWKAGLGAVGGPPSGVAYGVRNAVDAIRAQDIISKNLQKDPNTVQACSKQYNCKPLTKPVTKSPYEFTERKLPDSRGRYTIPNKIVRAAGYKPGDVVAFSVQNNRLVYDKNGSHAYTVDNDYNIRVNANLIKAAKTKLTTRLNPTTKEIVVLY